MSADPRTVLVQRAAYVLAGTGLVVCGIAVATPAAFGLTRIEVLGVGTLPTMFNLLVAWEVMSQPDPRRVRRLAFAQAMIAAVAAGVALGLTSDRTVSVLVTFTAILVYSGVVLTTTQHTVVSATGLFVAVAGAALGGVLGLESGAALAVVTGIAVLAGVGSRLHAVELAQREAATAAARRATRALDAAVQGITQATTTDHDQILQAVTRAAGELVDGMAVLYVLGHDGMVRVGAGHELPPALATVAFPPTVGFVGTVMQSGRTRTARAAEDGEVGAYHRMLGLASLIGTPIRVDGVVMGALLAGSSHHEPFTAEEIAAYALLAEHAGRVLQLSQEAAADRRALARLAELDRIKDDVVATVSHELRTPVTVIAGLAETLARRGQLPPAMRDELVQRLWANGVTLAQIVEQLLDSALLQRG